MKQAIDDAARVRIVDFKETRVAALEYRGDPALIGEAELTFIGWRKAVGLPPRLGATFNIWHDGPIEGSVAAIRLDLCAATERQIAPNSAGVVAKIIPGGRCAVLRHVGTEDGLGDAVSYLYADWLPRSGEALRDFPLYFQRISLFPDVPEHEAITDIFLPLR